MLNLTESAQRHFRRLIEQQGIAGLGVRMQAVHPGTPKADCRLEFCETSDLSGGEWSLACDGFSLYVDAQSMPFLEEAEIDYASKATHRASAEIEGESAVG
jgi:Fe/S biogenesis protein NfuA